MFGLSLVERATKYAAETLGPLFDLNRKEFEQLDSSTWRSPYVVGFVPTLITLQARKFCGPEVSGDKSGAILLNVWPRLTGENSQGLGARLYGLTQDVEFNRGADNAVKFFRVIWGKPDASDPIVASALETGKSLGKSLEFVLGDTGNNNFGHAAYVLWGQLFLEEVKRIEKEKQVRQSREQA